MTESEEDNVKIVASKLPREDFAIFRKLCDLENKTPNKKIRELITNEVDNKFTGIYRTRYDAEKIKQFQISTIEDYNKSKIIEQICKVNLVERSDGDFIQIGLRPVVDEDIFLVGGNVHPELPSLGRHIAVGERDFLIKTLLENEQIKKIKLDKEEIFEFPKEITSNNGILLISTDFLVNISMNLMNRIEYKNSKVLLDKNYEIIYVPKQIIGNRIMIIDKDAILWTKQKFHNEFTGQDESLDISINPKVGWTVDITVRSANKIKYLDPELIKILEVRD